MYGASSEYIPRERRAVYTPPDINFLFSIPRTTKSRRRYSHTEGNKILNTLQRCSAEYFDLIFHYFFTALPFLVLQ